MRRPLALLRALSLTERIITSLLVLIIFVSVFQIGTAYYEAHSEPVPGPGGVHIEGVTGQFQFLNPVLAQTDLDRDVTALVSCGLNRFDPIRNSVSDDAATHTLSLDQRTYTFTLRDDVYWHDGTPVTADDVIFTFRDVIQHENFPNPALAADFVGVTIAKIDDRTVTMTLQKKYAFFIFNTTVGLLPRHILSDTPVGDLLSTPFNLRPIGCGPYAVESVTGKDIRLRAAPQYFGGRPYLDAIVFRLFPSGENLLRNIDGVSGTKDLHPTQAQSLKNDARLSVYEFTLPQYVGIFFNMDREILRDRRTRLGLQLATNKNAIATAAGGAVQIMDTPLLEIATSDWKYEYDEGRADGALFDAGWRYQTAETNTVAVPATPATPAENTPARETSSQSSWITQPSRDRYIATDRADFFIQGTAPAGTSAIIVNDYQLQNYAPGQVWTYRAATSIGTLPENGARDYIVEAIVGGTRQEIDRISIFRSSDAAARDAWQQEKIPPDVAEEIVEEATIVETPATPIVTDSSLRYNTAGDPLALTILVLADRPEFIAVADELKKLWAQRGVVLTTEAVDRATFGQRLAARDYDMIIAGQNMGYNLDAYPFWHSSEAVHGSNLSNLKSSTINAWLEQIRGSFDSSERRRRLANLSEAFAEEVPAIILYTPTYHYVVDKKIQNLHLGRLALVRDRFAGIAQWYIHHSRERNAELGAWSFTKWFFTEAL